MTIVRFAPSPTGNIHIGNARTALLNWLYARRNGGRFIQRFDDTDTGRSTRAFARAIGTDLRWLGIAPDATVRQSERAGLHAAARDKLIAKGRLYPCYETPGELDRRRKRARALGHAPVYDRAALELTGADRAGLEADGRRPHWRFKLDGRAVHFTDLVRGEQTVNTSSQSDPVLIREDGSYLYTLPSVADDIDLGVTHIIRGEDHVTNTGVQIELFEALGAPSPVFAHHNLLTGAGGEGLSKRMGSLSIGDLRADGFEPMAVAALAVLTGTSLPVEPYPDLGAIARRLDLDMISRAPARYDPAELAALNARILRAMPYHQARPRLAELGLDEEPLWLALRENLSLFHDIAEWAKLISGPVHPVIDTADRQFLDEAVALLPPEPWTAQTWKNWTGALRQKTGRKGRALFLPLRMALTGRADGPELRTLLPLLGRKACVDRLS